MVTRIEAAADLRLDLDGVQARLGGTGSRLRLEIDRPFDALRQIRPAIGTARTRELFAGAARQLHEAGLTVDVVSSDMTLLSVGAGQSSRIASLVLGTPHVTPGAVRPVLVRTASYAVCHLVTAVRTRLRALRQRR